MIDGVKFKLLKTYTDDRGFFREIIRVTDDLFEEGFGQWSHSLMLPDVVKAWHYHKIQTDWWYVVTGILRVGLCDLREDSETYKKTMDFYMGDYQEAQVVRIPPGVAHGAKTILGPAHLLYVTSNTYNPADELRLPYDTPDIDFDWDKPPTRK